MQQLSMRTICSGLGVAPVTADRIEGLISGRINPDNFRSVEVWALSLVGVPSQPRKTMKAICNLMQGEGVVSVYDPSAGGWLFVDVGDPYIPTVTYELETGQYTLSCSASFLDDLTEQGYELHYEVVA